MSLILIVEDNPTNLKLVRDILQVKGFTTSEATTAEAGLVLAAAERPDLILMDIQLPGMNGIDALRRLRQDPVTAAIPVVAITASVMQQDKQKVLESGFDGFIEKPFKLRDFLQAVQAALHPGPGSARTPSGDV